jgi:hypothetical protein
MKKLLLKGILILGIIGVATSTSNAFDLVGYPTQHSPSFYQTEVAFGDYKTLGYPTQH